MLKTMSKITILFLGLSVILTDSVTPGTIEETKTYIAMCSAYVFIWLVALNYIEEEDKIKQGKR